MSKKRRVIDGRVYVQTRRGWRQVKGGFILTRRGWRASRRRSRAATPIETQAGDATVIASPSITDAVTVAPDPYALSPRGQWLGKYAVLHPPLDAATGGCTDSGSAVSGDACGRPSKSAITDLSASRTTEE